MRTPLKSTLCAATLVAAVISTPAWASAPAVQHDLVIEAGRVIDPASNFDAVANIGINGDTIVVVTDAPIQGRIVLNAEGLVVAPGFIDLHAHGQSRLADRIQAFDGVTSTLELESGVLPVGTWYAQQEQAGRVLNYGTSVAWTFARIAELEGKEPVAEPTWFQDAFSLTEWVTNPASAKQVERIVARIEQGLKEGSIGVGMNAGYAPGGGYKEHQAVHRLAASFGVPVFTHISGDFQNDPGSAAESIGDIISLAVTMGSQNHICHINSSSLRDVSTTLAMIAQAQKIGLPITTEVYTYGASSTTIGSTLLSPESLLAKGKGPADIEYNGERLDEASYTALRRENPGALVVFHFLDLPTDQDLLDQAVLFPGIAIASDAMPWVNIETGQAADPDAWPIDATSFAHPRSAGTFTRLFAQWVRERGLLSLSEAIRMSSLTPAEILEQSVPQMRRKGRIQAGMDADLVVFDPQTIQDNATFTQPGQPASGMRHVLVNGTPVIRDGKLVLDASPGRAIRRNVVQ